MKIDLKHIKVKKVVENYINNINAKVDLLFDYKDRHDVKLESLEKEIQKCEKSIQEPKKPKS